MNLPPNYLLLSVNLHQLDTAMVGGGMLQIGHKYNENERESSPVVARVEKGLPGFKKGTWLLCHFNLFDLTSPRLMYELDGLHYYSTLLDDSIFAIIHDTGKLQPVCGNILAERLAKGYSMFGLNIPEEYTEYYHDRVVLTSDSGDLREGDVVMTEHFADYEICYTWAGEQRRVVKILHEDVVGVLKYEEV